MVADWGWEDREGVEAWLATLDDPQLREAGRSIVEFLDGTQPQEDRSPAGLVERMGRDAVRDTRFRYAETRYWTARKMDEALVAFRDLPEPERDRAATAMLEAGSSSFGPRVLAEAVTHVMKCSTGLQPGFVVRVFGRHGSEALAFGRNRIPPCIAAYKAARRTRITNPCYDLGERRWGGRRGRCPRD